jgi:predicted metalloenzyme YecM
LCFNYSVRTWDFPDIAKTDTITKHDTLYLDTAKVQMQEFPKVLVISLDSVTIDTISTIVNGKVTDQKFKIAIK